MIKQNLTWNCHLNRKDKKIWQNIKKKGKKPPIPPPHSSSTPLKNKEISKLYDEAKEDYLQTVMTINKTDLDAAVENADEKNK